MNFEAALIDGATPSNFQAAAHIGMSSR